jgi:hypothetical protein
MSFYQMLAPYASLLPSLLPFFKGITPFLPNRPGTTVLQKRFSKNNGIDPGLVNIYTFNAV